MHPCLLLLDAADALLEQEIRACDAEDTEFMEESAAERADLLARAWDARDGYDENLLLARLTAMQQRQNLLQHKAATLYNKLGASLVRSKTQGRYFADTRHRINQAQKSYFCNTVS